MKNSNFQLEKKRSAMRFELTLSGSFQHYCPII